jgi:hypothetical protein
MTTVTIRNATPLTSRGQLCSESTPPASNCKSSAGQPIRNGVFSTYVHHNRLCQRSPLGQPYSSLPCQLAISELQQKKAIGPSASQPYSPLLCQLAIFELQQKKAVGPSASQAGSALTCHLAATTGRPPRRPSCCRTEARTLTSSLQRWLETNGHF